jgi:serine/threonine protein kinase
MAAYGGRDEIVPGNDSGMISQTIFHYRILEKLGGGGMGVVYEAEDLKLDRHVTLKFLPEEFAKAQQIGYPGKDRTEIGNPD